MFGRHHSSPLSLPETGVLDDSHTSMVWLTSYVQSGWVKRGVLERRMRVALFLLCFFFFGRP